MKNGSTPREHGFDGVKKIEGSASRLVEWIDQNPASRPTSTLGNWLISLYKFSIVEKDVNSNANICSIMGCFQCPHN